MYVVVEWFRFACWWSTHSHYYNEALIESTNVKMHITRIFLLCHVQHKQKVAGALLFCLQGSRETCSCLHPAEAHMLSFPSSMAACAGQPHGAFLFRRHRI